MEDPVAPWFVAIGASGGQGLHDIKSLLAYLPEGLPAIVLVVLHRPTDQVSHLRDVLSRVTDLPVAVASEGERLEPGRIYVGEPAGHLRLAAGRLGELVPNYREAHRNRTVDLLFKSVAAHGRTRAIGVVLSGSLDDGSRGLAAIAHAGGLTMVLPPSAQVYAGMPENAAAYDGPVDLVGSPQEIAEAIIRAVGDGAQAPQPLRADRAKRPAAPAGAPIRKPPGS